MFFSETGLCLSGNFICLKRAPIRLQHQESLPEAQRIGNIENLLFSLVPLILSVVPRRAMFGLGSLGRWPLGCRETNNDAR